LSVLVVGLEHNKAPLDLLERVSVGELDLPKVLGALRDQSNFEESILLSTCLRTEVYAVVDRFHEAVTEVQDLLADKSGLSAAEIEAHLTVRFDDDVATHLFEVASGLDSAVLGESEVLGQVRRAWERAQQEKVTGPVLSDLFRHAVQTGKRVRSETAIARGTTSFSHAALELAERSRPGGLAGVRIAVVGAGTMGRALVEAMVSMPEARRPAEVVVVNRTAARARDLAAERSGLVPVRAVAFSALAEALIPADVVFTATDADGPIVEAAQLEGPAGRAHPVFVVDLGVPRNVARDAVGRPGVTLFDMDDLRSSVAVAMEERRAEVDAARTIVSDEVSRYRAASRARGAAPVVAGLRSRLEALRLAELERHRAHLGDLSGDQWAQVDAVTRSVLAKLLHEPTVLLKETAGTPRGERLVEALRILFDL
jgi:glutamyl-tRNA reductase